MQPFSSAAPAGPDACHERVPFPRRPRLVNDRDPARTMEHAHRALHRIGTLELPADPPSFEVWYTYVTGQRPDVCQAIEEALHNGRMTVTALDRIHRKFFPVSTASERIDAVGSGLDRQTELVLSLIDRATVAAGSYAGTLAEAAMEMGNAFDRRTLRDVVARLIVATRAAEAQNRALSGSLGEAREEICRLQADLAAICAENLTDAVTGVANRKSFEETLQRAIEESRKQGTPLSLLMCDIDHFKRINDRFGHLTGDHALRLVAQALKMAIRGGDFLARFGGEEFAVLLPHTNVAQALAVAENVRAAVSRRPVVKRSTGENLGTLTISVGAAECQDSDTADSFIDRADTCLYIAKEKGRDCVIHVSVEDMSAFDWHV